MTTRPAMTKYGQIAHDLREAIASGAYAPGSTLPAIPDLMARYGVARDTVRDALRLLADEGLVVSKRGIGTIVRETGGVALSYEPGAPPRTWQQQTSGTGSDEVISATWDTADPDISARLAVPEGAAVVSRVRHFSQGSGVAQISEQWIPAHVAKAIEDNGGGDLAGERRPDVRRNLFELMADAGHAPARVTETFSVRMPDQIERDVMAMPPGVPVLVTTRVTVDGSGQPVETSTVIGAGDRMSASLTVKVDYR